MSSPVVPTTASVPVPAPHGREQDRLPAIVERYRGARATEKRARSDAEEASQACYQALFDEAVARIIADCPDKDLVSKVEMPYQNLSIQFVDGSRAFSGSQMDWLFTIDGQSYPVGYALLGRAGATSVYKHKLKRVRETVNRMLPCVRHIFAHMHLLYTHAIMCSRDKLLKLEEPVL